MAGVIEEDVEDGSAVVGGARCQRGTEGHRAVGLGHAREGIAHDGVLPRVDDEPGPGANNNHRGRPEQASPRDLGAALSSLLLLPERLRLGTGRRTALGLSRTGCVRGHEDSSNRLQDRTRLNSPDGMTWVFCLAIAP